jgi:hypothetical protein
VIHGGFVRAIVLVGVCSFVLLGCPEETPKAYDIWIINASSANLDGLFLGRDPRNHDWEENLLDAPIPPDGIRLVAQCLDVGDTRWIWPYVAGEGLVAHGVLMIKGNVSLLLSNAPNGDFKSSVEAPSRAVVCARFMIPDGTSKSAR